MIINAITTIIPHHKAHPVGTGNEEAELLLSRFKLYALLIKPPAELTRADLSLERDRLFPLKVFDSYLIDLLSTLVMLKV